MNPLVIADSPALRHVAAPVLDFGLPFQQLLLGMEDVLRSTDHAVGLAATQVGVSLAVSIIFIDGRLTVIANPFVTKRKGYMTLREGCLSLPGEIYNVAHPRSIWVEAQDVRGDSRRIEAHGDLMAQALQHETDHLSGRLIDVTGFRLYKPPIRKPATEEETE